MTQPQPPSSPSAPDATPPPRRSALRVELGSAAHPTLVRWTTWFDGRPGGHDSYVLFTSHGPVLLDPQRPDDAATSRLTTLFERTPIATVLTNDMHERIAYDVRREYGVPVWAPRSGQADLEGTPDHLYGDGDVLPGGLRALDIEGRFSGDTVLRWTAPTGERVLFTGDTLCGPIAPENPANATHVRRGPGLYVGAGPFYLMHPEPNRLRDSLRPLCAEEFDLICGAHGQVVANARPLLRRLLEHDWAPLFAAGQHPHAG